MSLGVGIIGYGRQGAGHAKQVGQTDGLKVAAIYDMTPASREKAKADHPDVSIYDDVDRFLRDESVEIVVVVTPTTSHAPLSIQSLEAGKHVVCEKPMCMNAKEAQAVREASYASGRFFSVYQNRRGDAYYTKAKAAIEAGHIGRLRDFKIIRNRYGVGSMTWGSERFRPQWRSERAYGGGMLFDWGGHWIDQALLLHGGRVVSVYAQLFVGGLVEGQDADDGYRVLLRFEDGACAHIEFQTGTLGALDTEGWILSGTHGGYTPGKVVRLSKPDRPAESEIEEIEWNIEPPGFPFWERFRDAVRSGDRSKLPVDVDESVRVMRIIDAAFASHDTKEAVVFSDPV